MTWIRRLSAIKPQCKHYQAGKQWNNIDAISLPSEGPCVFLLGGVNNSSVCFPIALPMNFQEKTRSDSNLQETWSHACGDKAHQSLGIRGVKPVGVFW